MKVTVEELEQLSWKRKKNRYAIVPDMLKSYLIDQLGQRPPDPPPVTRILGTWVFHDDEPVTMLDKQVGTEIKMAINNWVQENYGGGLAKPYREVTELQWDGNHFWMVTF